MVLCHATSCVSPFDHLPYGRARRSGSRPRLRAPFAPPPAHQYLHLPGSDDRARCSVKRTAIILAAALAVTTARRGRGDPGTAPAPPPRPAAPPGRPPLAAAPPAGRRP